MERKIFLTVLIGSLLLVGVLLMLPGHAPDKDLKLPWMIQIDPQGNSTVFGLTLGKSTLADAQAIFQDGGATSLLISRDGQKTVESYFERIYLNGLRGDFVLTLDLDPETVEEMFQRGVRHNALESGNKKVNLATGDMELALQTAIIHITYLPATTDLSEELLTDRFGQPSQILAEPDSKIHHWLYPDKGLDIAVDPERKEVFQYVRPADFEQFIAEPLKRAQDTSAPEE